MAEVDRPGRLNPNTMVTQLPPGEQPEAPVRFRVQGSVLNWNGHSKGSSMASKLEADFQGGRVPRIVES